ncbi:MAG TPA: hypothetical protein VNI20_09740 [Fimbriimonadaceae bacterium]|nr:hypothetical protein [Fimbriimonadaceae bacterium]
MAVKFSKNEVTKGSTVLTDFLCGEISAAEEARIGLKDRWAQNEQVYRNEPGIAAVRLFENFEPRTVPIMSPRINRIVNTTMTALTSPSPWVQALPEDGDQAVASALEQGLHAVMQRAGFPRVLRRALTTTALTGVSVVRARMTEGGVRLDHIHPNDFVVAPTYNLSLSDANLVGHRFYVPLWKLEERVRAGQYPLVAKAANVEKLTGANPDDEPSGRDPAYDRSEALIPTGNKCDDLAELFEALVRLEVDGHTAWYRAVVSVTAQMVLLVEPYPYDEPWYFDLRFHDEEGKWWPASSVAQNIVGLCLLQNDMFNLLAAGSMATVANPIVVSGGSLGKKLQSINLGQLYETPYDVRVQEIPVRFDPGSMPDVMKIVDNQIDAQTGVSQLSIGQEFLQSQTATAAKALIESTRQNEGSYAAFGGDFLENLWAFVHGLLRAHPNVVRQAYRNLLDSTFFEAVRFGARWAAAGKTPANAPDTLLQKLQALLKLAADPNSGFSYERVEDAVVNAMQLPVNVERLRKVSDEN